MNSVFIFLFSCIYRQNIWSWLTANLLPFHTVLPFTHIFLIIEKHLSDWNELYVFFIECLKLTLFEALVTKRLYLPPWLAVAPLTTNSQSSGSVAVARVFNISLSPNQFEQQLLRPNIKQSCPALHVWAILAFLLLVWTRYEIGSGAKGSLYPEQKSLPAGLLFYKALCIIYQAIPRYE